MGRKCGVDGCLSDSARPEDIGVTFHKVPCHPSVRPRWLEMCHIPEDKKSVKIIYVCSRHFLRADFCSFKGKKYMLKQGVLPSVFPWDKSKLESIKSDSKPVEVKSEVKTESDSCSNLQEVEVKQEDIKKEYDADSESKFNADACTAPESIDFSINAKIDALDFNNTWCPANIVEIDYEENEVLVHFDNCTSNYDEWICMDSPRLRATRSQTETAVSEPTVEQNETYEEGERCMALWENDGSFPVTVTKVLDDDMYEVLFDDGYIKTVKSCEMSKSQGKPLQSAPLFDPVKSTKQERRDRKRKLNVAALFGKRHRTDSSDEKIKKSPRPRQSLDLLAGQNLASNAGYDEEIENWLPKWDHGKPIGTEATLETNDGVRKSTIVPDPRLPPEWKKHLLQRSSGMSSRKWEVIIVGPNNKKFRSRSEIKHYLNETKLMEYSDKIFDFTLHKQRIRKSAPPPIQPEIGGTEVAPSSEGPPAHSNMSTAELDNMEEANPNYLKIPIIDDAYKCPIEGCGKNFRRENLAQMHVKHYHPEYTKFLDSTPNVADLAYARTVGESLDKSPVPAKLPISKQSKTSTPKVIKQPQSPSVDFDSNSGSPTTPRPKDQEIIKLLNSKPYDAVRETELIQPLPSGLPANMYPDIKLKDLLTKSDKFPKCDDLALRTMGTSRPSTGIKTLLPVIRNPEQKTEDVSYLEKPSKSSRNFSKRKKNLSEQSEIPKMSDNSNDSFAPPALIPEVQPSTNPNNVIIEGGQVIKIVRMKQEEIINCTCGFAEEDGLMIQCELCLCWQHAYCNNIERESQVPEKYVCFICQNPLKQRASRKYYHDQDWLKHGNLPTGSYHTKDEELLQKRFEKLKKSHDISGGLVELEDFVHSLRMKLKIAEAKNHPKLYLWSKPWEKLPLPEKAELEDTKVKVEDSQIKTETEENESQNESMLMMILKEAKDSSKLGLNNLMDTPEPPRAPQPEAAIESADCRLNLLEHIAHSQDLVMERLDDFEKEIKVLEENLVSEKDEDYPQTRQMLQVLMRDLSKLEEFSQNTSI